ncbi:Hypothetical predicted protein, partial [Paramuricea clavata]
NNKLEYIFYSNATHISYVSVDGGESTAVLSAQSANLGYDEQNYRLWYYDTVAATLHKANLDASGLETVSVPSTFGQFAVDGVNQSIYYLNDNDDTVKSIDYIGNHFPEIGVLQGGNEFQDIQIDPHN